MLLALDIDNLIEFVHSFQSYSKQLDEKCKDPLCNDSSNVGPIQAKKINNQDKDDVEESYSLDGSVSSARGL